MTLKLIIINILTLIRIIGTIILVPIYKNCGGFITGILALICYFTDSLDGLLARKWHCSTFFGALFDSVADKLFTILNFIVLYLITPYALIPIIFELLIIIVQFYKYNRNLNIQSNIVGKLKVWILAICVILTFLVTDLSSFHFLPNIMVSAISSFSKDTLYMILLLPAILMEALTLLSYLLELFSPQKFVKKAQEGKKLNISEINAKNKWESFKAIWLNPHFYEEHKNDSYLQNLIDFSKEKNKD